MGEEERKRLEEIELADVVDDTAAGQALDRINSGEEERSTGGFTYDFLNDPMYQQYRSQYMDSANRAMKDAMGQAAALTGGYGSSYAQRVGQQAYDRTMQGLNDVIPDLYKVAYQRYQDDYQRQQNAYQTLSALIMSTGYNPSEDELTKAGMSAEEAKAMAQKYAQDMALQQQQLQIQYMNAMPKISYGGGEMAQATSAPSWWAQLSDSGKRQMQASLGVTADGIWGPKTEAAYNARYGAGTGMSDKTLSGALSKINNAKTMEDLEAVYNLIASPATTGVKIGYKGNQSYADLMSEAQWQTFSANYNKKYRELNRSK